MRRRPLIIESPDLQSLRQRYAFAALTLLFWIIWFYLWIPLASLLAWALGLGSFYQHMIVLDGLYGLFDLAAAYLSVIVALGAILGGWSLYNLLRFRGKERRSRPPDVTPAETARFFGVSEAEVLAARNARRLVIRHDKQGRIADISLTAAGEERRRAES